MGDHGQVEEGNRKIEDIHACCKDSEKTKYIL